ncbi:MAG: PUA domain-containing protein [Candidatus Woesearchaeota archaeon]
MKYLSGKDKKNLQKLLISLNLNVTIDRKDEIIEFRNILFKNKVPLFIYNKAFKHIEEYSAIKLVPHLKSQQVKNLKTITIDVGAVPFLLKGVDMMRPGITSIQQGIERFELVRIVDEVKGLTIAVGVSLFDSNTLKSMQTGKSIKILHYFKDSFYNVSL